MFQVIEVDDYGVPQKLSDLMSWDDAITLTKEMAVVTRGNAIGDPNYVLSPVEVEEIETDGTIEFVDDGNGVAGIYIIQPGL